MNYHLIIKQTLVLSFPLTAPNNSFYLNKKTDPYKSHVQTTDLVK